MYRDWPGAPYQAKVLDVPGAVIATGLLLMGRPLPYNPI